MNTCRALLVMSVVFFAACKGEPKPSLDLHGHWLVDHGFDDGCQVGATFTESELIISVYSLVPNACQPELFGIENNAVKLQIVSREDYLNDADEMATELEVSLPARAVTGTIQLTESFSGLTGEIVVASDPNGFLEPLIGPVFLLTKMDESWESDLMGTWGASCESLGESTDSQEICKVFDFSSLTEVRLNGLGGCSLSSEAGAPICEPSLQWADAVYAVRFLSMGADSLDMDIVLFLDMDDFAMPFVFEMTADSLRVQTPMDGPNAQIIELFRIEQ